MKLYSYWRSSASYRVRIALNLKGLDYDIRPVNLLENEHRAEWYCKINPQGLVPTLVDDNFPTGVPPTISQSLAIIDYLEEMYPHSILLPDLPDGYVTTWAARAHVRQMAQIIACDIHPLQNRRVLEALWDRDCKVNGDSWRCDWVADGFTAYEKLTKRYSGNFSFGDKPTLADCCLIPQVYNAARFGCNMTPYPNISRIYDNCMQLEEFQKAAPENQPDAPQ